MLTTYAPRVSAHPTRTGVKRDTATIRVLVVHTSEGGEGPSSAEGLAGFIGTPRTDTNLASYHYIADHDRVIPIVPDNYVAYANAGANHDGLSICHPGKAAQTPEQWDDESSSAQREQVARWLADKTAEYGIPLVKISATQLVLGARGVCGHVDVTKAYKRSAHTDPGSAYPWDRVINRARQLANPSEEDDMPTVDEIWAHPVQNKVDGQFAPIREVVTGSHKDVNDLAVRVAALEALVGSIPVAVWDELILQFNGQSSPARAVLAGINKDAFDAANDAGM